MTKARGEKKDLDGKDKSQGDLVDGGELKTPEGLKRERKGPVDKDVGRRRCLASAPHRTPGSCDRAAAPGLAAPDIDVDVFRAQLQTIGPLSPPMTLLVSKDDKALEFSNLIGGSRGRVGALDIENPVVREAALKAKVQVVDISALQSRDGMNHSRFTALAELYPRLQRQPASEREKSGIFVIDANSATVARLFEVGNQAAIH